MAPPTPSAVDMIPRHLQSSTASASSSSNASPAGTPPAPSSVNTSQPSFARSPSNSALPLPSPGVAQGATTPGSPGGGNRFGLALGGFIQRRPRGWTTSSAQRSPATSPAAELPPSPSAGERTGYGFPALRRSLSKRTSSTGDQSRTRQSRSSSQPPAPVGLVPGEASTSSAGSAAAAAAEGRAALAASTSGGGGASQAAAQAVPPSPNPQFSSLTATTSLPNPPPNRPRAATASGDTSGEPPAVQKLRLVPHLESSRSLHFDPIERDLAPFAIVRVGRFTDRSQQHGGASGGATSANAQRGTATEPARVAFKSKVVSRGHAEVWVDDAGKFFIRDTKSSSGTFLNHIRLSSPNVESRPFALKDGDVLQLGVDYQGGTEEIYRCVKMRVELNRGWQRGANSFNTAALAQLRALGATPDAGTPASASSISLAAPNAAAAAASSSSTGGTAKPSTLTPHASTSTSSAAAEAAAAASITDCCICLYPVTVCQALFIAPCSHVTHFKCIRPLVEQNYPGFSCPLCRTYANLEADVEIDLPEPEPAPASAPAAHVEPSPSVSDAMLVDEPEEHDPSSASGGALGLGLAGRSPPMAAVEEADEPASRAASIRSGATGRAAHGAGSRRSSMQGLSQALAEGAARARSRPASIAPGAAEEDEDEEMLEREQEQEQEQGDEARARTDGDRRAHDNDDEPASAFASRRIGSSSTSSSSPMHLAPPVPEDLYASLASAATPPNNTFLSTLADSGAVFLPSVGPLQQGSIDAAVMAVRPGPGVASSSARGSGSGASGGSTDGEVELELELEGEGEGEGDVSALQVGSATSPQRVQGKGKGKARDEPAAAASSPAQQQPPAKQRKRRSSLFEGMTGSDHPDPSVAAALLM